MIKFGALTTTLVETGIQAKFGSRDESETAVICTKFWPRNSKLFPHLVSVHWAPTDSEPFTNTVISLVLCYWEFLGLFWDSCPFPKFSDKEGLHCRRMSREYFLTFLEGDRESCTLCVYIEVRTSSQRTVHDHKQNLLFGAFMEAHGSMHRQDKNLCRGEALAEVQRSYSGDTRTLTP